MPFEPGNEHGKHNNHARGFECRNLEQLKSMRWIQRGEETLRVPVDQLETYLADGWKRGRPKPSVEARKKMREAQLARTDRPRDSHTQEHRRNRQYKARYKKSNQDYEETLAAQDGHCFLCPEREYEKRRLCWDHDHDCCPGYLTCGKCVRALLCMGCNRDISVVERIRKEAKIVDVIPGTWTDNAINYLQSYSFSTKSNPSG
jgi:hypothetical protein